MMAGLKTGLSLTAMIALLDGLYFADVSGLISPIAKCR